MVGASIYLYTNRSIFRNFIYSLLTKDEVVIFNKYFLPYKTINLQAEINSEYERKLRRIAVNMAEIELFKKNDGTDIETIKSNHYLSGPNLYNLKNPSLEKYRLTSGFYSGIKNTYPGSGYIDFHKDNMVIASARGIIAFSKNFPSNKAVFKQIQNNIDEFINLKQFKKDRTFSIRDLLIYKKGIYISYIEEISEDCWNTSVISGDFNYKNINFTKLFSSKECIHSNKNIDKEFRSNQSGGRMIPFDDSNIIFSIGDYRSRHLAQKIESVNGKLIKINFKNGKYKIISMGHRNPQGLYLDKDNNFLLSTEHGPMGGDEINLLKEINKNENNIFNFGWAIASAGEHYGGKNKENKKKYEKYPLYKSHSDNGFVEPLYSFVPSIGISEIVKTGRDNYVVSSLKDNSLYFFTLKDVSSIKKNRVRIGERIRDLKFKNNYLYLFLEDTASIGIINLN